MYQHYCRMFLGFLFMFEASFFWCCLFVFLLTFLTTNVYFVNISERVTEIKCTKVDINCFTELNRPSYDII